MIFFAFAVGLAVVMVIIGELLRHPVILALIVVAGGTLATVKIRAGILGRRQQRIDAAHQAHVRELRSREIASYHLMDPREFEHAIAYLCERDGCRDVQVVGGAGDLGADVIATAPDGRRIVIQCKRYGPQNKVGSPDMQRFAGTCRTVHGAHVAALVTTSVFTRPAAELAGRTGIGLFNADGLAGWASRTGPAPWH